MAADLTTYCLEQVTDYFGFERLQRVSGDIIEQRRAGQIEMFPDFDEEQYKLFPDFRRQLKARSMEYGIPLQILRESTLRLTDHSVLGERPLTALSDRMWNIGTALYYKCGGKPWRLISARDGVCYIGIAFRRIDMSENEKLLVVLHKCFLIQGMV